MALGAGLSTRAVVKPVPRLRMKWVIPSASENPFDDKKIVLPTHDNGTYDYHVDWGDGSSEDVTAIGNTSFAGTTLPGFFHTYSAAGTYYVTITGKIKGWSFNASASSFNSYKPKLKDVLEWGPLEIGPNPAGGSAREGAQFKGCTGLTWSATDRLHLGGNTNLTEMFSGCSALDANGLVNMNTSAVTSMKLMFYACDAFNKDFCPEFSSAGITAAKDGGLWGFMAAISNGVFNKAFPSAFTGNMNQNTDFGYFLYKQGSYNNSNIGQFNMSAAIDINYMLHNCAAFNQNLAGWDISNVGGTFSGDGSATTDMSNFMTGANALSTSNYDYTLEYWGAASVQNGVSISFGDATYTGGSSAATARAHLVSSHSWTIYDGGEA
tara:strand:- start:224 stop:1363 length:1140 start_codon:yes stop_codon:yes gene_type:complete